MSMSKVACEKLLEKAHLMGMDAGRLVGVTPMVVGSPSPLLEMTLIIPRKLILWKVVFVVLLV